MLSSMLGGLFGAITGAKGAAGSPNTPSGLDGLIKMLQPGSQSDPQHQAAVTDILNRRV
jgi:hypothetical protein